MLALDSSKWSELHAFGGSAAHVPCLLREVYADPYSGRRAMEDVWSELWGDLHHQGGIYDASIYAVPHLVAAGLTATAAVVNDNLIWLCVVIERSRLASGHAFCPEDVMNEYNDALVRLSDVGLACTSDRNVAVARRAVKRLLSRRRGRFLPPQKPLETPGGLFSCATSGNAMSSPTESEQPEQLH